MGEFKIPWDTAFAKPPVYDQLQAHIQQQVAMVMEVRIRYKEALIEGAIRKQSFGYLDRLHLVEQRTSEGWTIGVASVWDKQAYDRALGVLI